MGSRTSARELRQTGRQRGLHGCMDSTLSDNIIELGIMWQPVAKSQPPRVVLLLTSWIVHRRHSLQHAESCFV